MIGYRRIGWVCAAALGLMGCVTDEDAGGGGPGVIDESGSVDPTLFGREYGCRLFKDANYGGASMLITPNLDYNDLHRVNGFGDNVSSISCNPDYPATVWSMSNFTGTGLGVYGDLPTLGSMNDVISSISWGGAGPSFCTFFADANFGGNTINVYAGRDYNDTHKAVPNMGDNIGSIYCTGTVYPTVCKSDTWGNCIHLVGAVYPSLSGIGYNDNISSITW